MRNLLLLLLLVLTATACEGDYTIVSQNPGETVYVEVEVPTCLLYTSPSPRDVEESRMPSSA